MAYDIKIAKHLIEEGFIKEELSYCKEIERWLRDKKKRLKSMLN
jgi:membrane-bound lytic murein transglycosylase